MQDLNNNFTELEETSLEDINGGGIWSTVGKIAVRTLWNIATGPAIPAY